MKTVSQISPTVLAAPSEMLVEAIQRYEKRIGLLVDKAAFSTPPGWLPTDENDELFEKWAFVIEAEAQMQARYRALREDTALD